MTKFRIGIFAAVALLLLGLPPAFGLLTEHQLHRYADADERVHIAIDEYERGWFSSRGRLSVLPPAVDQASVMFAQYAEPIELEVEVNHGPLSLKDGIFVGLSEMFVRPVDAGPTTGSGDFDMVLHSTFGGNINFLARLPSFHHSAEHGVISFSGGRIDGTIAGQRLDARTEFDSLQLESERGSLSLLNVRATLERETDAPLGSSAAVTGDTPTQYIVPGSIAAEIGRFAFELKPAGAAVDASGLRFESGANLDDRSALVTGAMKVSLQRARIGDETTITDAQLETRVGNVDAAALDAWYHLAAASGGASPPPVEFEPVVLRLLAGGPSFAIETLRFALDGDPFEAALRLDIDAAALPQSGIADLSDIALWGRLVSGRGEISAAKSLVERLSVSAMKAQLRRQQAEGQEMPGDSLDALAHAQVGLGLAMLDAQGLIKDTGALYRTVVTLENGRLTVNEQTVQLPVY